MTKENWLGSSGSPFVLDFEGNVRTAVLLIERLLSMSVGVGFVHLF